MRKQTQIQEVLRKEIVSQHLTGGQNMRKSLIKLVILLIMSLFTTGLLINKEKKVPFDKVKHLIAKFESANGVFKVNANNNRTIDCGLYQINSIHFIGNPEKDEVLRSFNSIFERHGVGKPLHERVVGAIMDDALNEDLARSLYNLRGLEQWNSSEKVMNEANPPKIEKPKKVVKHESKAVKAGSNKN